MSSEIHLVKRSGQVAFPVYRLKPAPDFHADGFASKVCEEFRKKAAHAARSQAKA